MFSNSLTVRSNPDSNLPNQHTALAPVTFPNNSIRQETNLNVNPSLGNLDKL